MQDAWLAVAVGALLSISPALSAPGDPMSGTFRAVIGCTFTNYPTPEGGDFQCGSPGIPLSSGSMQGLAHAQDSSQLLPYSFECAGCRAGASGSHWETCAGGIPTSAVVTGVIRANEWAGVWAAEHGILGVPIPPPIPPPVIDDATFYFPFVIVIEDGNFETAMTGGMENPDTIEIFRTANEPIGFGHSDAAGILSITMIDQEDLSWPCPSGVTDPIDAMVTMEITISKAL